VSPPISGLIFISDFEFESKRWRGVDDVIGIYRVGPCTPYLTSRLQEDLRNIEAIANTPLSKRKFDLGELVRVVNGPFRSLGARIERFDRRGRLCVGVEIFGRTTPIELSEGDINKN
jgi:transcriptional antiterminator NusG